MSCRATRCQACFGAVQRLLPRVIVRHSDKIGYISVVHCNGHFVHLVQCGENSCACAMSHQWLVLRDSKLSFCGRHPGGLYVE